MKTRFGSVEDQQGQNKQSQKLENSSVFSTLQSVIQKMVRVVGPPRAKQCNNNKWYEHNDSQFTYIRLYE